MNFGDADTTTCPVDCFKKATNLHKMLDELTSEIVRCSELFQKHTRSQASLETRGETFGHCWWTLEYHHLCRPVTKSRLSPAHFYTIQPHVTDIITCGCARYKRRPSITADEANMSRIQYSRARSWRIDSSASIEGFFGDAPIAMRER